MDVENGAPIYYTTSSYPSDTISTTPVWPGGVTGYNLTGQETTFAMWDAGGVRTSHQELYPRVTMGESGLAVDRHSTWVAGVLVAAGNLDSGALKGMSYQANLTAYGWASDLAEMQTAASIAGIRLSNHSYSQEAGWQSDGNWYGYPEINPNEAPGLGSYNSAAANLDSMAYANPFYLSVWAAGNNRQVGPATQPVVHQELLWSSAAQAYVLQSSSTFRPLNGDAGGFDTLAPQACAKNVLTVGSIGSIMGGVTEWISLYPATDSSTGPTDDGRIKPDVVAQGMGVAVVDSASDTAQAQASGTSLAAPAVTGSINLLTQLHAQLYPNSSALRSSTYKGLVIQTADSGFGIVGPTYTVGYGAMNTKHAAELLSSDAASGAKSQLKEVLLQPTGVIQFPIVSAGNQALKVTICWVDPPGPPSAPTRVDFPNSKLVNDLNLSVLGPDGVTVNLPWVLNPDLVNKTSAARSAAATRGDNDRDTVEQVFIPNPSAGTYTVRVSARNGTLYQGLSQWVSILVSGNVPQAKPTLQITGFSVISSTSVALTWNSLVGQNYQIQNEETVTGPWVNIGGQVNAYQTSTTATLTVTPAQMQGYFRVIEVP